MEFNKYTFNFMKNATILDFELSIFCLPTVFDQYLKPLIHNTNSDSL